MRGKQPELYHRRGDSNPFHKSAITNSNYIDQGSAKPQVTGRQPRPLIYISSEEALAAQGRVGSSCNNEQSLEY